MTKEPFELIEVNRLSEGILVSNAKAHLVVSQRTASTFYISAFSFPILQHVDSCLPEKDFEYVMKQLS